MQLFGATTMWPSGVCYTYIYAVWCSNQLSVPVDMPSRPVHDRIYYDMKWQIYEVFLQYWALPATLRRDHDATIWCLLLVHICCLMLQPTLCASRHAISTCTLSYLLSCEVADIRSFPSILSIACNSSARPRCDHLVSAISAYMLSDVQTNSLCL